MKRLNKEYKLNVCDYVSLKYGSVNKENPQVIYISGKCWIKPFVEMDCQSKIKRVERQVKNSIKSLVSDNDNFEKKFILDFDVNMDGMSPGKKKFLSFDFFLRQNEKNKKKLKELDGFLKSRMKNMMDDLVFALNENDFNVEKNKN